MTHAQLLYAPSLWGTPAFCLEQSLGFFVGLFFTCRYLQVPQFCLCIFIQVSIWLKTSRKFLLFLYVGSCASDYLVLLWIYFNSFPVFAIEHTWQVQVNICFQLATRIRNNFFKYSQVCRAHSKKRKSNHYSFFFSFFYLLFCSLNFPSFWAKVFWLHFEGDLYGDIISREKKICKYQANVEWNVGHSTIKRHLVSALFLITSKLPASFKECKVNVVELNTNQPFRLPHA